MSQTRLDEALKPEQGCPSPLRPYKITSKSCASLRAKGKRSFHPPARPGTRTRGSPLPMRITSAGSPPNFTRPSLPSSGQEKKVDEEPCHFAANFMLPPQASANPSSTVVECRFRRCKRKRQGHGRDLRHLKLKSFKAFNVPVFWNWALCGI